MNEERPTNPPAPMPEPDIEDSPSLLREFAGFLRENKKWWLIPLILVVLVLGLLIVLGTTAAAPLIYTLF